jgi:hypothetical protein
MGSPHPQLVGAQQPSFATDRAMSPYFSRTASRTGESAMNISKRMAA